MSGARGFALIEVLVAGALIAVALIIMSAMMTRAYGTLDRSGEQTAAAVLAQQRLEWLRNQGALSPGTTVENLSGPFVGYTRTTTITSDMPRAGVMQLMVQTDAPSGISVRTVSLRTAP